MRPLVMAILVVLVACLAGYGAAIPLEGDLEKTVFAAATGLLYTGLLGGVLKLLLDDVVRERERRQEHVRFRRQVLEDLKAAYYAFERSRTLILADRTVAVYDEQMPGVIDACTKLRAVQRALQHKPPAEDVKRMGDYVEDLVHEYRDHRAQGPVKLADDDLRSREFKVPLDAASDAIRAELAKLVPPPRNAR